MLAAFSLIVHCIIKGNLGEKGLFLYEGGQDLELRLHLPTLMCFGTPYWTQFYRNNSTHKQLKTWEGKGKGEGKPGRGIF